MAAMWSRVGAVFSRLVPKTLFQAGGSRLSPTAVRIGCLPYDAVASANIQTVAARSRAISLLLDPDLALLKRMTIPRAAAGLSDRAISLNVRQSMPNQGQGLTWRAVLVGHRDAHADYNVYMLKKVILDELVGAVARQGGTVDRIALAGLDAAPVWERRPDNPRLRRLWLMATGLGIIGIAGWSIVSLERRASVLADATQAGETRVAALQNRLVELRAAKEAGDEEQNATLTDLAQFNAQSRRLGTLTALTDVFPDTVWISEVSITGDTVLMSGFVMGDVAEIVTLLQTQTWAEAVRLEGPITYDSYSGQNRFDLGLRIRKMEPSVP